MAETARDTLSRRVSELKWRLQRTIETIRGSSIELEPYDPDRHNPLISYAGPTDQVEIERYWVNAPYAFVSIQYDEEENEHTYNVVEPDLDEFERDLLEDLFRDIRDSLIYSGEYEEEGAEEALKRQMVDLLEEYGVVTDMNTFYRLYYYLYRAFEG
ncbi:MAG: type II secretion system protein, partial [Halobacteriaceae archaeon]